MVGFNIGKWLDYSVKNNLKTLLFATREYLILLQTCTQICRDLSHVGYEAFLYTQIMSRSLSGIIMKVLEKNDNYIIITFIT